MHYHQGNQLNQRKPADKVDKCIKRHQRYEVINPYVLHKRLSMCNKFRVNPKILIRYENITKKKYANKILAC